MPVAKCPKKSCTLFLVPLYENCKKPDKAPASIKPLIVAIIISISESPCILDISFTRKRLITRMHKNIMNCFIKE
jgi:mRNA-degrading endonuclease HigB of HigAB toxin-antitoxin module